MSETPTPDELTPEELERQQGEPLPERAAMSVIDPTGPGIGRIPDDPNMFTIQPVPDE
jgi:hypothetical protein